MWLLVWCALLSLWVSLVQADVNGDGIDDVLIPGLPLSQFVTADAFTVLAWTKVQGAITTSAPCYEGAPITGDAGEFLTLGRQDATQFCGYMWDGANRTVTAPSSPGWHHLALRKIAGGPLSLWVDGVQAGSIAAGSITTLTSNVIMLQLGFVSPDRITQVTYVPTALADTEIHFLAGVRQHFLWKTPPSAVWPLTECGEGASGNGKTFYDYSGQGRHALGDHGPNGTGLLCSAAEHIMLPPGVQ